MVVLKVKACDHQSFERYGRRKSSTVTCLTCWERLMLRVAPNGMPVELIRDFPPGECKHPSKKTVVNQLQATKGFTVAHCRDCGRMLRHPIGRGEWEDMLFYGFVIREDPF